MAVYCAHATGDMAMRLTQGWTPKWVALIVVMAAITLYLATGVVRQAASDTHNLYTCIYLFVLMGGAIALIQVRRSREFINRHRYLISGIGVGFVIGSVASVAAAYHGGLTPVQMGLVADAIFGAFVLGCLIALTPWLAARVASSEPKHD